MSEEQPWTALVTREQVVRLHSRGLVEYGGEGDSKEWDGCIDGHLDAAWTAEKYFQTETYGGVPGLIFAGFLMHQLITDNCFADGNRAVAWLAGAYVLRQIGLTVSCTGAEAHAMFTEVMIEKKEPPYVVRWVADRLLFS